MPSTLSRIGIFGLFPSKKDAEIQSKRRKMFDVCLILKFSDNH